MMLRFILSGTSITFLQVEDVEVHLSWHMTCWHLVLLPLLIRQAACDVALVVVERLLESLTQQQVLLDGEPGDKQHQTTSSAAYVAVV